MSCIYSIRNAINGHERFGWRYNGKANNDDCLAVRFKEHIRGGKSGNNLLGRDIKKYGIKNFRFGIHHFPDCAEDAIYPREEAFIARYNCVYPNGYNFTPGGENPPNHKGKVWGPSPVKGKPNGRKGKPSPLKGRPNGRKGIPTGKPSVLKGRTRPVISAALKGRPNCNKGKTIPAISLAKKGKPNIRKGILLSDEHRKAVSLGKTGIKASDQHRKALSLAKTGKPWSEKRRAAYNRRYKIG